MFQHQGGQDGVEPAQVAGLQDIGFEQADGIEICEFGSGDSQHARRQVQRRDAVTLSGQADGVAARAAADFQDIPVADIGIDRWEVQIVGRDGGVGIAVVELRPAVVAGAVFS
ncbi:hypothetical protein ABAC460_13345 [Asticcacaulis sp. AC460]|nr:hypothetical protein ABAC460_13345 [Asticcacaulis sp. AC460]